MPLLALNGEFGHPGVQEQFDGRVALLEGATIAACGHLIAEEQPQAVAEQIIRFALRHPGRSAAPTA